MTEVLYQFLLFLSFWFFLFNLFSGLALITKKEALLWTDGRYFLQATQELSDQWKLMRIGEDPAVDIWMADVSFDLLQKCFKIYTII